MNICVDCNNIIGHLSSLHLLEFPNLSVFQFENFRVRKLQAINACPLRPVQNSAVGNLESLSAVCYDERVENGR